MGIVTEFFLFQIKFPTVDLVPSDGADLTQGNRRQVAGRALAEAYGSVATPCLLEGCGKYIAKSILPGEVEATGQEGPIPPDHAVTTDGPTLPQHLSFQFPHPARLFLVPSIAR